MRKQTNDTYLLALTNASSIEELWAMHTARMAEFGFDRLLYGFTHYLTNTSLGDPDDFIILTNHSEEYRKRFMEEGHYFNGPMVRWALENEGACSWSLLQDLVSTSAMTELEHKTLEFNKSMDVTAGYSISFKAVSARSKGAIALTAKPGMTQAEVDAVWAEHGSDLIVMNNIAHLKILTLPYITQSGRHLTKRQREALEWVGDGKTTQDIALLMGLTAATVEKHLRLARESLNVETTAQAVLKAAFQNQMFILEA